MDVSLRRLVVCLLLVAMASILLDGVGGTCFVHAADAAVGDEDSATDGATDAGEETTILGSFFSVTALRGYTYGAAKGILILAAFWILGVILLNVIRRLGRARHVDEGLAEFLGRVVKVAALILGAITALSEMGIDVGALVAGLGLTGFAFGFAFKDIISNVLSGILIIIYKPFQVGDQIKIKAYDGNVVSIDLRYTVLNREGKLLYIPNSLLFTDAIIVDQTVPVPEIGTASE
ncbi:MAG: mechanosensitive ion channel domain-containing protein [Planctomycetota bacterium]|nr:mechanosensitive ion channel domain-containing protein [Planctomycetota bacterium]